MRRRLRVCFIMICEFSCCCPPFRLGLCRSAVRVPIALPFLFHCPFCSPDPSPPCPRACPSLYSFCSCQRTANPSQPIRFGYQITGKGRWISLGLKIPKAKGGKKKQKKGGGGERGEDYDSDHDVSWFFFLFLSFHLPYPLACVPSTTAIHHSPSSSSLIGLDLY
jgi:hypothetical protein